MLLSAVNCPLWRSLLTAHARSKPPLRLLLASAVRSQAGAEVGETLTIFQSGDPDVIFTNHARCKNYSVRYDSLYCGITALILTVTCNNLLLHTPLKHLNHEQHAQSTTHLTSMLGWSPVEEPAHCTCLK